MYTLAPLATKPAAIMRPMPRAPPVAKRKSAEIAEVVRREVKSHRQKFLVATLNADGPQTSTPPPPPPPPPPPSQGHAEQPVAPEGPPAGEQGGASELLDSRTRFLELCQNRHWQFDELGRAQWATLMMLATLGGAPQV